MPRDYTEITSLLMPMYSGTTDNYREHVPSTLALGADRVLEGDSTASSSMLLNLPGELLEVILLRLDRSDLLSLAMVSSACCRLARSQLFKKVTLEYSFESSMLVVALFWEALQRKRGATGFRSLGLNVRHMRVATRPEWLTYRHAMDLRALKKLEKDEQERRLKEASDGYDKYVNSIAQALSGGALPNLRTLEWCDFISTPKSVFDSFACSSAVRLKLPRVALADEFEITVPPSLNGSKWPLTSLHLELASTLRVEVNIKPLALSMLRACAETLEHLHWEDGLSPESSEGYTYASDGSGCQFPRLRSLSLTHIKLADKSVLEAFLGLGTKIRELNFAPSLHISCVDDFLETRGQIESLQTLLWGAKPGRQLPRFLQRNTQISKLMVDEPLSADSMSQLLEILSSFEKLESLSLEWPSDSIPKTDLEMIGTFDTLRQLCLSAGYQFGWRHTWAVDHTVMRKHLRGLQRLRKLAFSRDSYLPAANENDTFFLEHYYSGFLLEHHLTKEEREIRSAFEARPLSSFEGDTDEERRGTQLRLLFQEIHRPRMVKHAHDYGHDFPRLTWLYLGKHVMGFRSNSSGQREAYLLFEEQDDCWTALREIFGTSISGS